MHDYQCGFKLLALCTARDSMDGKDGRHVLLGRPAAPEEPTNC